MAKKAATKKTTIAKRNPAANPPGEIIPASEFALIENPAVLQAISYNLQGEQISESDLDRIRVPAAGGVTWEVPTLSGDVDSVKEIEGIILHSGIRRAFWENPNPTGDAPDCASSDGLYGIGDPGGECATCPFNEFGSAIKADGSEGRGKRCREMRAILFLRREDRLPVVVMAPPASLKNVKQYMVRLPCHMYQAVTKMTLEADQNADKIKFSKIKFSYVGALPTAEVGELKSFAATLKKILTAGAPVASDFNSTGNDEAGEEGSAFDGADDPANYSEE
jgi:hypothetical protein